MTNDYAASQSVKNARYKREYEAWIAGLSPKERARFEAEGLAAPCMDDQPASHCGLTVDIAERGVGEVRTVLGRRRLIPKDADAWQRFTALVNTPVQGGCADGMKRALVLIASRLPAGARLISTVHDEVIVESPEADAEAVCAVVRESMISSMTELFPQVPIEVEAGVCERWSEK